MGSLSCLEEFIYIKNLGRVRDGSHAHAMQLRYAYINHAQTSPSFPSQREHHDAADLRWYAPDFFKSRLKSLVCFFFF